ncbi:mantle protein-like isoform X2 [Saccostrea echinata]|uniref:mantle protein-like isoform X2 n=1 Tax=Saccostrea echinata TaxID=191078 RepID=UPI002A80D565|nr:mantle protein-like isoform X2 [Saccostrea echinata]
MIAALLLSLIVGALAEPSVHVVPHAKQAVHEVAHDVHRHVGLIHQVPVVQKEVKVIRNEIPRIVTRPKIIRKTKVHVQKYIYDKPFIRKHTIIKPVEVVKKFDVHKTVDVPTPIHKVRTVVRPVHVDQPYPKIVIKKKTVFKENKIFRPKPVFEERVTIKKQPVPVPITEHVFKNVPQPRLVVKKIPVDIFKHIHRVRKEPVAVANVKTVGVEFPVIDRKKIHVPVAKAHGGYAKK